jgi:hypothetical protein
MNRFVEEAEDVAKYIKPLAVKTKAKQVPNDKPAN